MAYIFIQNLLPTKRGQKSMETQKPFHASPSVSRKPNPFYRFPVAVCW